MGELIVAILYAVVPIAAMLVGLAVIRRDYKVPDPEAAADTDTSMARGEK